MAMDATAVEADSHEPSAIAAELPFPAGGGLALALARRIESAPARASTSVEGDFDRLIEHLHRHAREPDALREAAGALRHTVESALWQSARGRGGRLALIHAEVLGNAAALFIAERLRRLARGLNEWLVLISSPRRMMWAVQAAWRGDDVAEYVRANAEWHTVEEITICARGTFTPIVKVGVGEDNEGNHWSAATPLFEATRRYSENGPADDFNGEDEEDKPERPRMMVVVGKRCEVTARVSGNPPIATRADLQHLCDVADEVLGDRETGHAERTFRLKQVAAGHLKKKAPVVARQFWQPLTLLALLLTGTAVLLGSVGVERLRWERMVSQLDAEPGIEVISHSAAWGRRKAELLRDPLAKSVSALLLEMGCDPASVQVTERPFLSAEEPIFAARQQTELSFARQVTDETRDAKNDLQKLVHKTAAALATGPTPPAALDQLSAQVLAQVRIDLVRSMAGVPADVELRLADGVLTAKGALAEPAFSKLAEAPRAFAWLSEVDMQQLRDLTAENITALKDGLEKIFVEFVPASSILPEASKLRLQSIAAEMVLLAAELERKQAHVRLRLRAAHPLLDDATLEQRHQLIRRELERQGVPAAWWDVQPVMLDAPGPNVTAFSFVIEFPPFPAAP